MNYRGGRQRHRKFSYSEKEGQIHFQLQKNVTHTPTSRRNERIDH